MQHINRAIALNIKHHETGGLHYIGTVPITQRQRLLAKRQAWIHTEHAVEIGRGTLQKYKRDNELKLDYQGLLGEVIIGAQLSKVRVARETSALFAVKPDKGPDITLADGHAYDIKTFIGDSRALNVNAEKHDTLIDRGCRGYLFAICRREFWHEPADADDLARMLMAVDETVADDYAEVWYCEMQDLEGGDGWRLNQGMYGSAYYSHAIPPAPEALRLAA